jgi:ABC-type microcin C transport system duplicated ATPase subunit YejF
MAALIEGRGLVKRYGGVQALAGVDISLRAGETTGLVGESGSGKSTLARVLLGLEGPDSGSLSFDGRPYDGLGAKGRAEFRRRVQIVFQDSAGALDPRMSVGLSVEEGLANLGLPRAERERRSREAFDEVGLPASRRDDYPHQFSGGQRHRIAIARAIVMRPDYLVLDECTASLDALVQSQIVGLLTNLGERLGLGYLFVSHDLNLIAQVSRRIAVMRSGRIVEEDEAERVIRSPRSNYAMELFDSMDCRP